MFNDDIPVPSRSKKHSHSPAYLQEVENDDRYIAKMHKFETIPLMILPHFKNLKCMTGPPNQSKEA